MRGYIGKWMQALAGILLAIIVWVTETPVAQTFMPAYAETANDYDNTNVMDDLGDIDLSKYPADPAGEPELHSFVEYCYSDNAFRRGNYGVYIYVYNPGQTEFSAREGASVVNMAVSYTAEGEPSGYKNLPLKVCGTTTGEYARLFYKFRVLDAGELLTNAAKQSAATGARRYDVAGVQLLRKGAQNATDYKIGRTYFYTGYAKGYGGDSTAESTIKCEWEQNKTIELDVHHTNYRMASEYKENARHEVNSVYFSVPDEYITEYGNLQGIRAEWYEYKTAPIFVTQDSGAYDVLKEYIGKDIGAGEENLQWVVWSNLKTRMSGVNQETYCDYGYNKYFESTSDSFAYYSWGGTVVDNPISKIAWLFSTGGADYKNYIVSREAVEAWAKSYCGKYGKPADILDKYSGELFADSIDADRVRYLSEPSQKRGYVLRDFDAGDEFNLLSYGDTHNGWDKFADYFGHWWDIPDESGKTYRPIEEVSEKNYTKDKGTDCSTLLLNTEDYDDFAAFCDAALLKGEHPFLFRFAQTDYFSAPVSYDYTNNASFSDKDGYIAQQTCFLNFDVIQLTFQKDGVDTVIPVVADPIDIFNAVDPPVDKGGCDKDLMKRIIGIAVLAFFLFLFWRPLWWLIKNIVQLIAAPFQAIANAVKKKKTKKK